MLGKNGYILSGIVKVLLMRKVSGIEDIDINVGAYWH